MIGPLVTSDEVPKWLRPLITRTEGLTSQAFTQFRPPTNGRTRAASVLILFGDSENGGDVLLLRRADTLDSHAGQVAFPGGGVEIGDHGPVETALREAEEETGADPSGVRPLAILPELFVPVSGFVVTPILAYWENPSRVHAVDPGETAAVARVPIADLVNPANRYQVRLRGNWQSPVFEVSGLFVWGFTAGLLSVLLALGGWEQEWDQTDVRDLDVALSAYQTRIK